MNNACDPAALKDRIAVMLKEKPESMPRSMAQELNVPLASVIRALPDSMRQPVPASDFELLWERMTAWEKVTFIAESPGMVVEVSTRLGKGRKGHGMFNLMDPDSALHGHIMMDDITEIWLVSKPMFGLESHSVLFFNAAGEQCFGVYVGRDAKRALLTGVKEDFLAMWQEYAQKEVAPCAV